MCSQSEFEFFREIIDVSKNDKMHPYVKGVHASLSTCKRRLHISKYNYLILPIDLYCGCITWAKEFLDRTHTSKPCEIRLVAGCPCQSLSFRESPAIPEHRCTTFMSRPLTRGEADERKLWPSGGFFSRGSRNSWSTLVLARAKALVL